MTNPGFSLNLWGDLQNMMQYGFMRHAFLAGTIVAVVAGIVGYFVVLRRSAFAAHALSHAGFAGAAAAVLLGISPIVGLLVFTTGGGLTMSALSRRAVNRDTQVGIILSFMLGLGVLFISLYKGYATEAYSILFGQILGISANDVVVTAISAIVVLVAMAAIYRPLLFASLDEDVAEAKGLPVVGLGVGFMVVLAIATSIAVQVVGVLLIFTLMVTPAAIAERLVTKVSHGLAISVAVALSATWLGLFVSYYLSYPVSFFITTFVFALYLGVRIRQTVTTN